jgi:hypothetical protein
MKLTKEQKADLIENLSHPWGGVVLLCDGDEVALRVQPAKGLRYHVATYVNGWFRGEWMRADKPVREQRYLRKVEHSVFSPVKRAKAEKELGKRFVKKHMSDKYTLYHGTWPNGKAAIAHLCKVCDSVQVKPRTGAETTLGETDVVMTTPEG